MKIGLQTWGSEGDVQLFIALSAGLVKAGHEVTLVITDNIGRDYSALGKRFGFRVKQVRSLVSLSSEDLEKAWREIVDAGNPLRQADLVLKLGFDSEVEPMLAAAKELCATCDAVVSHFFVFPLRIAAEKAQIPLATVTTAHNCLPSKSICPLGFPKLGSWAYPFGWKLVRMLLNKIFLPRVNALRDQERLPPKKDLVTEVWTSDLLNIVAVSPTICQAPADWAGRHSVCGFMNLPSETSVEEPPPGLEDFIAAGEAPIYFTFGSMLIDSLPYIQETAGLWMQTVRHLNRRAVFQLPWNDLDAFPTDDRVFKVRRSPYKTIFPKCALIVHHGGAGTTQSSLLAGRPSVVVAHFADQFFWGAELERLGVAGPTQKRKGLSAKRLASSIEKVLSVPGMSSQALALGTAMARENGVQIAVSLIEAKLGAGLASNNC